MLDRKRLKATVKNNKIIIICFHVLIAIKVTSRITTLDLPGWDVAVAWTTFLIPFAAIFMTAWLTYYYIFLSEKNIK
ncbi:MAG: hypothetical protein ACE5IC_09895 [Candidatus Brocadiales bacterium]